MVKNCFRIYHISWITSGLKHHFLSITCSETLKSCVPSSECAPAIKFCPRSGRWERVPISSSNTINITFSLGFEYFFEIVYGSLYSLYSFLVYSLYDVKRETRFRKRSCHGCQKEKSFVTYHNRIITFHRSTVYISDTEVLSLAKLSKSSSFYLLHFRKPPWIKWSLKTKDQLIETQGLAPCQNYLYPLFCV